MKHANRPLELTDFSHMLFHFSKFFLNLDDFIFQTGEIKDFGGCCCCQLVEVVDSKTKGKLLTTVYYMRLVYILVC